MNECGFSRCGRTDKGVSAMRQVISLTVRSTLPAEQQQDPDYDNREIDYIHILNQLLPPDIRMYQVCLHPPEGFDARFSCVYRHYKYFFNSSGLDIKAMTQAASDFEGSHDFRNFCKIDGSKQITNFERRMIWSKVIHISGDLYCFDLKGTAFLWHQVRSMMAILFLIGQGQEHPDVVNKLLDANQTPLRPLYLIASDKPLVLYDCGFGDDVKWIGSRDKHTAQRLLDRVYDLWHQQWIGYVMGSTMRDVIQEETEKGLDVADIQKQETLKRPRLTVNLGDGRGKCLKKYVPLAHRATHDSPENINARWRMKKGKVDES